MPSWAELKEALAREIDPQSAPKEDRLESSESDPEPAIESEPLEPMLPYPSPQEEVSEPEPETALAEEEVANVAEGLEADGDLAKADPSGAASSTDPEHDDEEEGSLEAVAAAEVEAKPIEEAEAQARDKDDAEATDEAKEFDTEMAVPEQVSPLSSADDTATPDERDLSADRPALVLSETFGEMSWEKDTVAQNGSLNLKTPPAASLEPQGTVPISQAQKPRQISHMIGAALGFLAVIVVGAGLWFQMGSESQSPAEALPPEPAQSIAANPTTELQASAPLEQAPLKAAEPTAESEPAVEAVENEPALESETAAESGLSANPAAPLAIESAGTAVIPVEPSFDLIRIEANGDAVIAGRATPNTDLILLDNGKPIGTTRSNADGEWAFVPSAPLPPGEHQFAMVVSTPQGEVVVPERSSDSKQETETAASTGSEDSTSLEAAPLPAQAGTEKATASEEQSEVAAVDTSSSSVADQTTKSDGETATPSAQSERQTEESEPSLAGNVPPTQTASPPAPKSKPRILIAVAPQPYGIQLSSNSSRDAARKSWQSLQRKFPDLLGDKELLVQKVTLAEGGTRFRVQTGFFEEEGTARKLCRAFGQRQQDCLVFRR